MIRDSYSFEQRGYGLGYEGRSLKVRVFDGIKWILSLSYWDRFLEAFTNVKLLSDFSLLAERSLLND